MSTAAILAGGRARRLGGRDKSQLVIDGQTILDRQLHVLRRCADRVVIIADDLARFADIGVPVFGDLVPDAGALGGIYTALAIAKEPVLVIACDMPYLTAPFLTRVMEAAQDADVAVPHAADGYHPLCACYTQACAEPIRQRLDAGVLKVLDLFRDVHVRTIDPIEIAAFDPDGLLLLNINTPDDLARAERGHGRLA
ncbi:MAG: molybdenum cofactor guanylyltransferase [Acidobacteria bacterium]|jgi:molybdopterin-guanine dinucleotide biosynthesis protein A|nr:molybdenum cofactor guanylyltransferase [Acidobacteriota bacterium]